MSTLKKFSEWLGELDERLCGFGTIIMLHPDTGEPMQHTIRPEYFESSFTNNTRPTAIDTQNEWQAIDIEPDIEELSGFEKDEINSGYVYTGNCTVKPRKIMATLAVEVAGNNQNIEVAFFRGSRDGLEIIPATHIQHEFRVGGVLENMVSQAIITLGEGDRILLMFRNITSTTEVTFETVQKTLI
jgi:hypothetical protein